MRKIKYFILIGLIIIMCGCSSYEIKNENNSINQKKENNKYKSLLNGGGTTEYNWNCDVDLHDIKDINTYYMRFISNEGYLYEFDLMKKYSTTNNNCRKIDTEIKFERFIMSNIISNDKKIYIYDDEKLIERPYGYTGVVDYSLFDYNNDLFLLQSLDSKYGVIKDNKIYLLEYEFDKIPLEKELYIFENGENFINSSSEIIKTNKGYYKYDIINKKECNKYADIKCEYGIIKDDKLTDLYNDIYYINNHYFILNDDNKIYTDIYGG